MFSFAILNVVTAVFCQSAINSAQLDKDLATMQLLDELNIFSEKLTGLFKSIDSDESGFITLNELEDVLSEPFANAYMESLGISTADAWTLVKLLDHDKTGTIDLAEFVSGCRDLRGGAKAIHVATLAYDQHAS